MSYPVSINDIATRSYANSKAHGFWEGPDNNNIPTKLMLIVSEVSEALEAYRSEEMVTEFGFMENGLFSGKPVGFPSELADIVIRVADLAERLGINLEQEILNKMAYNASRPYRHGRKI